MIRRLKTIMTYNYASKNHKNLGLNLLLTAGASAAIDIAFLAACFLILLII